MPGQYLEKKSRAKPKNDPKCADYRETSEKGQGAASYRVPGRSAPTTRA